LAESEIRYTIPYYRELLIKEGCKQEYLTELWMNNHYRLIIWKAAAMQLYFDGIDCWNPKYVVNQLLYRYDCEINLAKRSFLRLAVEGDGAVNGHVVMCVASISVLEKSEALSLELTDGWYVIKAEMDLHLEMMIKSGKLYPGQKLHVQGCKITGANGPCTILESPPTLRLTINSNSTRIATRFELLGSRKSFFPVNIKSVFDAGGPVFTRIFPTIYFEKLGEGKNISRSSQIEDEAIKDWQVLCYLQSANMKSNLRK
jgi:breast cancer 2 susceptibility protein